MVIATPPFPDERQEMIVKHFFRFSSCFHHLLGLG
jgi:hypothetical protein